MTTGASVEERANQVLKKAAEKKLHVETLQPNDSLYDYSAITTDVEASDLMPNDVKNVRPITTYGDGNCLPYALSLAAFGHPHNHLQVRVNLAIELLQNVNYYANKKSLIHYCQTCRYGTELSDKYVRQCIREEALNGLKNHAYMGVFHVMASAEVLGCFVNSVYPTYGGHNVRGDLNVTFSPRSRKVIKELNIMWTNTNGKATSEALWAPNHFVPLITTLNLAKAHDRSPSKIKDQSKDEQVENMPVNAIVNIEGSSGKAYVAIASQSGVGGEEKRRKIESASNERDEDRQVKKQFPISESDYLAVYYSRKPYFGKVISCNEDGTIDVKFLEQIGSKVFRWPKRDDIVCEIAKDRVVYCPLDVIGTRDFEIPMLPKVHILHKAMRQVIG